MSEAAGDEIPSLVQASPNPSRGERPMADVTPLHPASSGRPATPAIVSFDRRELGAILNVYGRYVAAGEWRDYAIDCLKDRAVFSIYRRTSEMPLYRIEKAPKLARKQGAFSVLAPGGRIVKRGHELVQVLKVLEKKPKLVEVV